MALVLILLCCISGGAVARTPGGALASSSAAATAVGLEILRAGGNAADAAVATALALAVVRPEAGNLGGGGFAVTRFGGAVRALDFRETAPAAATRDMFLDERGDPRPEASLVGPLAAGVPGSPAGLYALQRELGRLPWAQVVAPAIRLARDGFVVDLRLARAIWRSADLLGRFPETAAVWLPAGQPPRAGTRLRLPELAATLEAYAAQGPRAIAEGAIAAAVERAARRHGGLLRAADLAAYRPVWRAPLRFSAFGWELAAMPLPSSGGIIIGQTLGLLEHLDWPSYPSQGAERLHLLAEAWRRAFADRILLGDPATTEARAADLLAGDWLRLRARGIDVARATPSDEVGPWPHGTGSAQPGGERPETTHLSVVDGLGNAVSLTTTLNGAFGCGLMVPEAGFLLNNEMDDFATAPDRPNLYGLIQGEANAVAPGKRMLSSMSPTIAWRGGELIVLGSPGGSTIPTATVQVLLSLIVDGDTPHQAVARPRIHHQWRPDVLVTETLPPRTATALERRGHARRAVRALGEVMVVARTAAGAMVAASDPRHPGSAGLAPASVD